MGKKLTNETNSPPTELVSTSSYQDLFSCDNRDQAKEMIINGVRHDGHHNHHRTRSTESSSDEPTVSTSESKKTRLLAGPRFRTQTRLTQNDNKHDTIYPISIGLGVIALILVIWKPISAFFSGLFLGLLLAAAGAYVYKIYFSTRTDEENLHQWIDFSDLETMLQEKVTKPDKRTSLNVRSKIDHEREEIELICRL